MVALEVVQQLDGRGSERKGLLRQFIDITYVTGYSPYDLQLVEAQANFRYTVFAVGLHLPFCGWKFRVREIFCIVVVLLLVRVLLELIQLALQAAYAPVHFGVGNVIK